MAAVIVTQELDRYICIQKKILLNNTNIHQYVQLNTKMFEILTFCANITSVFDKI